ncbi:peptide chain release factor 1 [Desulfurococcaceae archaeon AG1]|nr:peptide chain release factor 1 [Desulfurococcaceae archaeon AG1]
MVDRRKLKQIISYLKTWQASATILLSLYIPPGRPVADVLEVLRRELSIAQNIKLKRTRDAVETALSMAIDRLSKIPKIPQNGLVIFAGVNPDTGDQVSFVFSPPDPVPLYYYRTDKWFHTEFLEPMVEESEVYGIIIIERDQATIAILKPSGFLILEEIEDYIPGKHSKGGQSQRRYDRIIEQMVEDFYKKVGERASRYFIPLLEEKKLKGILIGGPGYAKLDFVRGDYLDYRLKSLIIGEPYDVSYQGEPGVREIIMKASNAIKGQRYIDAINAVEEFKIHLAKDDGLALYGVNEIKKALEMGAVRRIVILEESSEADELEKLAKSRGAEVHFISSSLPEGEWIKKTFGDAIAILRYRLE